MGYDFTGKWSPIIGNRGHPYAERFGAVKNPAETTVSVGLLLELLLSAAEGIVTTSNMLCVSWDSPELTCTWSPCPWENIHADSLLYMISLGINSRVRGDAERLIPSVAKIIGPGIPKSPPRFRPYHNRKQAGIGQEYLYFWPVHGGDSILWTIRYGAQSGPAK